MDIKIIVDILTQVIQIKLFCFEVNILKNSFFHLINFRTTESKPLKKKLVFKNIIEYLKKCKIVGFFSINRFFSSAKYVTKLNS